MLYSDRFFQDIWPVIAEQVTRHRAGADADILPLLRRLGVRRGARVLDVPCGFGRHALVLARCGYRVTGVDISPELLAQARAVYSGASQGLRPALLLTCPVPQNGTDLYVYRSSFAATCGGCASAGNSIWC